VSAVDDYLGGVDASTRVAFEHIRDLVLDLTPDAEEGTSYGMAALKYRQKPVRDIDRRRMEEIVGTAR